MNKATTALASCVIAFGLMSPCKQAMAESPTGTSPPTFGEFASGLNPMNWKMPQWKMPSLKSMLPGQDDKTRIVKKKDGLVSDVKQTASKSWQKTKEIFDPSRLSPSNLFVQKEDPASKPDSPGFFGSLFGPREPAETERIATANEFLAQPRVDR
ncbi:hypothetical protein [Novipirellula artificiosorum]|uniref:Uncharacterized protein n=1 Tax=Novipirellula artificiosorum TaxID=2528016 RepID=A0A5C6D7A0_9BACT|nr:hypothetical protein [Novipirellula artificiosorum]TWU31571.1 hypothetical protein Poly41_61280 [Novipirellula artificiosorum]